MRFSSRLTLACALAALSLSSGAEEIRMMTFNIRYANPKDGVNRWENRRAAVAALIKAEADVVGLQEVLPVQREQLMEECPEFAFLGVGREIGDLGESSPVIYRKDRFSLVEGGTFWFSETPSQVGSKTWGNVLPRICTWARLAERKSPAEFYVFNVHLDDQSQESRQNSVKQVAKRIAEVVGKTPAVLLGDFNALSDNPAFSVLNETTPRLTSVYEILNVEPEGTFHGFKGETKFLAIDFIFLEKERWQVKSREVFKTTYLGEDGAARYVSDHYPVKAVLELNPQ